MPGGLKNFLTVKWKIFFFLSIHFGPDPIFLLRLFLIFALFLLFRESDTLVKVPARISCLTGRGKWFLLFSWIHSAVFRR